MRSCCKSDIFYEPHDRCTGATRDSDTPARTQRRLCSTTMAHPDCPDAVDLDAMDDAQPRSGDFDDDRNILRAPGGGAMPPPTMRAKLFPTPPATPATHAHRVPENYHIGTPAQGRTRSPQGSQPLASPASAAHAVHHDGMQPRTGPTPTHPSHLGHAARPSSCASTNSASTFDAHACDPCIIRVSAAHPIAKEDIIPAMAPIFPRGHVDAALVRVAGPSRGRRSILKPMGSQAVDAETFVDSVMEARRIDDGPWMDVSVAGAAADASLVPIFMERDRSFAKRKRGFHLGQLARAMRSCHLAADIVPHRASATVVIAWQEVAKIEYVEASGSAEVVWNDAVVTATGLDKEAIITTCLASIAAAGPGRRQPHG